MAELVMVQPSGTTADAAGGRMLDARGEADPEAGNSIGIANNNCNGGRSLEPESERSAAISWSGEEAEDERLVDFGRMVPDENGVCPRLTDGMEGSDGGSGGTVKEDTAETMLQDRPVPKVRFSRIFPGDSGDLMELETEPLGMDNDRCGGTVILNVGGTLHQVKWETIDKFPKSRLQRLRYATTEAEILSLCDSFALGSREFYFDRSPRIFENVLGLYRKGELHLTESVCPRDFLGELDYWGLSALHLEPCCAYTLQRASWLLPIADHGVDQEDEVNPFHGMCCAHLRNVIWKLFEDPNSSTAAKVLVIVSSFFLLASIMMLILSTVPEFQDKSDVVDDENYFFRVTEAIFVGWFTLEYIIRFLVAPNKVEFILSFLNIIDLLGILPFYFSLTLTIISSEYSIEYIAKAAQIFRILRILRIFKLSRHITGLKTLGTTLRNSHRELLLLSMTVSMGMLIFAGLGYALEKDEPETQFYTLPQTLYWAIITMTSTGYGDIAPKTSGGKLVASLCAICGVLCITLPIPIIVANFNRFNDKVLIEQQINEARKGPAWDITRHHLKQAKAQLDRERSRQRRLVGNGQRVVGGDDDDSNGSRSGSKRFLAAAERWRRFAAVGSGSNKNRSSAASSAPPPRPDNGDPDSLDRNGRRGLSVSLDLSRMSPGGGSNYAVPWLCNGGNIVNTGVPTTAAEKTTIRSAGGRYVSSGSTRSDETLHI